MDFDRFLKEAAPPLGLDWRKYRRRSARHRVEARMRGLGIADFSRYLELIRSDAAEAAALPDLMRVTVSRFFREHACWDALSRQVLPGMLRGRAEGEFRVWSAGCCGGEEPYSLAIVWLENFSQDYPGISFGVMATDIDGESLSRARRGIYGKGSLREVPAAMIDKYFLQEKGLFRIRDEVRALVRFEERNLLSDPPPKGIDLLLCRYLAFTYYQGERLEAAAGRLKEALSPAGVLMAGLKEAANVPEGLARLKEGRCFYRFNS